MEACGESPGVAAKLLHLSHFGTRPDIRGHAAEKSGGLEVPSSNLGAPMKKAPANEAFSPFRGFQLVAH